MIIFALAIFVLIGFVAISIDAGFLMAERRQTQNAADAGALARRLNSEVAGARSLVMGTYRALPLEGAATPEDIQARLVALDERWNEAKYWQAIAKNASRWTGDYLLASVDLRRDAQGHLERMPADQRVFGRILARTFEISAAGFEARTR